jgi:hypothetical protein
MAAMMLAAGKHAMIWADNECRYRLRACSYLQAALRRNSSDSTIHREGLNVTNRRQAGGRSGRIVCLKMHFSLRDSCALIFRVESQLAFSPARFVELAAANCQSQNERWMDDD